MQVADLHYQVRAINERLDQAGLRADLNLADRFEDLAQTVADALDAAAPRGPAAPYWIGLDRDTYHARLAELRWWADTVLCQHYGGYELRDCWPHHMHAVWELSTLAAEWRRTYGGSRPDLARAPEWPAPEAIEPPVTKKAVLLALYRAHLDYGDRSRASRVVAELAPQAGLQAGTARSYLYAELDGRA